MIKKYENAARITIIISNKIQLVVKTSKTKKNKIKKYKSSLLLTIVINFVVVITRKFFVINFVVVNTRKFFVINFVVVNTKKLVAISDLILHNQKFVVIIFFKSISLTLIQKKNFVIFFSDARSLLAISLSLTINNLFYVLIRRFSRFQ